MKFMVFLPHLVACLENVTMGESVTSIGNRALAGCTALKVVAIPASVESFEPETFHNCNSLQQVDYCGKATPPVAATTIVFCTSDFEDGNFVDLAVGTCTSCPHPDRCVDGSCVEGSGGLNCASCLTTPEPYYQAGQSCERCPQSLVVVGVRKITL